MDFNLPEELQMLKQTVRRFVDQELIPIEMHSCEGNELKSEIRERLEKKTREMGLWLLDVPQEYGGVGLGLLARVTVWEEIARSDFAQLMAVTDPSKGSRGGISCFLVDLYTAGCRIKPKYKTMMGDELCEMVFEDCKVPATSLVGKEGEGFELAQKWLGVGRLKHGARALGVAERCIEMGARYAKQRVTFGKPLSERQAIQWMLADSYVELHASRLMVYHAAWKNDQGEDMRNEAYMVKLYVDEMSFRVVDRVLQIHGGIGLTTDLPLEKWFRDQRSRLITEGPSEVMRMVIARYVLQKYP